MGDEVDKSEKEMRTKYKKAGTRTHIQGADTNRVIRMARK